MPPVIPIATDTPSPRQKRVNLIAGVPDRTRYQPFAMSQEAVVNYGLNDIAEVPAQATYPEMGVNMYTGAPEEVLSLDPPVKNPALELDLNSEYMKDTLAAQVAKENELKREKAAIAESITNPFARYNNIVLPKPEVPYTRRVANPTAAQYAGNTPEALAYLQSKEGAKNSYPTKNMAGSSAYGKYQFMPSTAKSYAKRIGIPAKDWKLPKNQEKIMQEALKDYRKVLKGKNIEPTSQNIYAVHQLGQPRLTRMANNSLTVKDLSVLEENLPKNLRGSGDPVRAWKKYYQVNF